MKELTVAEAKARHLTRLRRAYEDSFGWPDDADDQYRLTRAAVFAAVPGKQTNKNMLDAMNKAIGAVVKKIRGH